MPSQRLIGNRVTHVCIGRRRPGSINARSERSAFERQDSDGELQLGPEGILGDETAASRRPGDDNHALVTALGNVEQQGFLAILPRTRGDD